MRHTKPRFRMQARLVAIKRRRKAVEFMAGLSSSESNGFFLFRKRNPFLIRTRGQEEAPPEPVEEEIP